MAMSNLTTWLLWYNSYILVQVSLVRGFDRKCKIGNPNPFWNFLSVVRPFYSHTQFSKYHLLITVPIHPACFFSLEILLRLGLHGNVGGCKYADCFWQGLIEASVRGTFLTMDMRIVRNQWFLCWLINFVNLCWAFIQ